HHPPADKIDTQPIEAIKGATTGVALIFVNSDGENVIGINAGANSAVTPEYLRRYQQQVIDADALLMQLESPLDTVIAAAKLAKQHQTQVILNPAPARKLPDELLTLVDMITPNETEAERLTGIHIEQDDDAAKAAQILHDKGIATVIITLGSRGVWLSEQGKGKLVAGFKVNAVDTIAAGDTFNGALLTALLEGQSMDVAVRFAHAAAAIAVTRPGAQPSIPWRAEIDSFLQERV
ncbi:ribokinase, partial [Yersinia pestis]|uniref:ribokinase n=1 Tax=Yersinia pestis TaxID=632 RepID=UPI0005787240